MTGKLIKTATGIFALLSGILIPNQLSALEQQELQKAKEATVFVKSGAGTGTAFCIESSNGYFLTNYHVVKDSPALVTLVANPGSESKESTKASVLLVDPENDLALLKANFRRKLPSLSLGIDADLKETDLLTAFGYPFGTALAADGKSPAVSVNTGRITSLRRKDGKLSSIQTDAAINRGNSGGPMLNEDGNVIGIVKSGNGAAGLNFAIPPEVFVSFLKKPFILTDIGDNGIVDFTKENSFSVRVSTVLPNTSKYTLEIFLNSTKLKATETQEDIYAVHFPKVAGGKSPQFKVVVRLGEDVVGELSGNIRSVESRERPGAVFATMTTLPLKKAPPAESVFPSPPKVDLSAILSLSSNQLLTEKKDITFEEPFSRVSPGGHGRYLVFYFPASREIRVFDLAELKMLGAPLQVGSGDLLITAGAERIVALDVFESRVYSIPFDTLTVENSKSLPWTGTPFQIEMGRSSDNMAVISYKSSQFSEAPHMRPYFLDIPSLEPLEIEVEANAELEELRIRSSANGRVMTLTNSDCVGTSAIVESGKLSYRTNTIRDHGWKMPSLDGTHLLKCCGAVQTLLGQNLAFYPARHNWLFHHLPSGHPAFYVRVGSKDYDNEEGHEISLIPNGELRPIINLKGRFRDLDDISKHDFQLDRFAWNDGDLSFDRRIHLIPQLQILATLPPTNDKIILRPFPFGENSKTDTENFLYVSSVPPVGATPDIPYVYEIEWHSSAGNVRFEKVAGPENLKISNKGKIEWLPETADTGNRHQVVLRLVDGDDDSRYHSFTISVEEGE